MLQLGTTKLVELAPVCVRQVLHRQPHVVHHGLPRKNGFGVLLEHEHQIGARAGDRLPFRMTSLEVGDESPAAMCSSVDCRHPEGPISATNSPLATEKETSSNANRPWAAKRFQVS